jgi:type IV pilus assembly protein PilV
MKRSSPSTSQRGFLLIEALVAMLIFALGILGMIAMGSTAISAQSDAHYRTDAARFADDITSAIAFSVDRSQPAGVGIPASLAAFQHHPSGSPSDCAFTGTASASPLVTDWVSQIQTTGPGLPGLPGASDSTQQIVVTPDTAAGGFNRVEVTICWRAPGTPAGSPMRHHTLVTYIN